MDRGVAKAAGRLHYKNNLKRPHGIPLLLKLELGSN